MTDALNEASNETPNEDTSKQRFFERIGALSDEMIAAHGRDFAMGALILAARFIAQGQPVTAAAHSEAMPAKTDTPL